jgi:hypothetical protein
MFSIARLSKPSRTLRTAARWPQAALLDRFSPRAILNTAGTEKRPFQPNRKTTRGGNTMKWCSLCAAAVFFLFVSGNVCLADALKLPAQMSVKISSLAFIKLSPGLNRVTLLGMQTLLPPDPQHPGLPDFKHQYETPAHLNGTIFEVQNIPRGRIVNSYIATVNWVSPNDVSKFSDPKADVFPEPELLSDSYTIVAGYDQTSMFFQGIMDGHKETFLVTATRHYRVATVADIKNGNMDFPSDPLPTDIAIYAFSAGTPASYDAEIAWEPEFRKIDDFLPKKKYCSSYNAIALELQPVFASDTSKMFLTFSDGGLGDGEPRVDSLACSGDED